MKKFFLIFEFSVTVLSIFHNTAIIKKNENENGTCSCKCKIEVKKNNNIFCVNFHKDYSQHYLLWWFRWCHPRWSRVRRCPGHYNRTDNDTFGDRAWVSGAKVWNVVEGEVGVFHDSPLTGFCKKISVMNHQTKANFYCKSNTIFLVMLKRVCLK